MAAKTREDQAASAAESGGWWSPRRAEGLLRFSPDSQPPNDFPIEVPTGVNIAGSVTPAPTITIPAGAAGGFTYSYAGPTTSPGKDGGHLENLPGSSPVRIPAGSGARTHKSLAGQRILSEGPCPLRFPPRSVSSEHRTSSFRM